MLRIQKFSKFLIFLLALVFLAGCAGFPPPPIETVDAGPVERDAAVIEHGLIRENRSPYQCGVRRDASILCQGVRANIQ